MISPCFQVVPGDKIIFSNNKQEVTSRYLYNYFNQSILKNDSFHEYTTECFHFYLKDCSNKNDLDCLDDLNKIIRYNNSGCMNAVLSCNCATYNMDLKSLEIGKCIYNCQLDDTGAYLKVSPEVFEWNDKFCGPFNRSGTLCGKCQEGLYSKAYSYDLSCIKCANILLNWWKYIFFAFFPLTCFCFLILCFNLVEPSFLLQGFALYCQIISAPLYLLFLFGILLLLIKLFN